MVDWLFDRLFPLNLGELYSKLRDHGWKITTIRHSGTQESLGDKLFWVHLGHSFLLVIQMDRRGNIHSITKEGNELNEVVCKGFREMLEEIFSS